MGCVMRSVYEQQVEDQREIVRRILRGDEKFFGLPVFGRVCKAIWWDKTAIQMANELTCSARAIEYQIYGESRPSADAIVLINRKMIGR